MVVKINGKKEEIVDSSLTLKELLVKQGVESIEMVSVQLNGTFIPKEKLTSIILNDNDEVDFLFFMGGGSQKHIKK